MALSRSAKCLSSHSSAKRVQTRACLRKSTAKTTGNSPTRGSGINLEAAARSHEVPMNRVRPPVARLSQLMCWRVTQSSEPLRYRIVEDMDLCDSRTHYHPPRWNGAPSANGAPSGTEVARKSCLWNQQSEFKSWRALAFYSFALSVTLATSALSHETRHNGLVNLPFHQCRG